MQSSRICFEIEVMMSLDSICIIHEWRCWEVKMRSYLSSSGLLIFPRSHGAETTPQRPLRLSPIAGKREKLVVMALVLNTVTHVPIASRENQTFMTATISHIWNTDETPEPCIGCKFCLRDFTTPFQLHRFFLNLFIIPKGDIWEERHIICVAELFGSPLISYVGILSRQQKTPCTKTCMAP